MFAVPLVTQKKSRHNLGPIPSSGEDLDPAVVAERSAIDGRPDFVAHTARSLSADIFPERLSVTSS
jgi:hypothetical protein